MSEQQSEPTATAATPATTTSACPHPEAVGRRWGDPISPERQEYLDRWQKETDHGERKGPFDGIPLTGAEVSLRPAIRTFQDLASLTGHYVKLSTQ